MSAMAFAMGGDMSIGFGSAIAAPMNSNDVE